MHCCKEYSLSCCDCNEGFATKEDLKVHLMLVHLANWTPYKCEKCPGLRTATVDGLKGHQKMCHPKWSEKTLIYYYNDEKEAELRDLLRRSLERQPNNASEFKSEDVVSFGLQSSSPPCLLPTSSLPCSSMEADILTENNTSAFEMETAAEPDIQIIDQADKPAKKRLPQARVRFVCKVCRSVSTDHEQVSKHKCSDVTQPTTVPVELPSKSPPLLTPLYSSPYIRIRNSGGSLEAGTRSSKQDHEALPSLNGFGKRPYSEKEQDLCAAKLKAIPPDDVQRRCPSDPPRRCASLGKVRSTPDSQRPTKELRNEEDNYVVSMNKDAVASSKCEIKCPGENVKTRVAAKSEHENPIQNVEMVVLDSAAIGRLESSRPLMHGLSGFLKSRKGGLKKMWHGYEYYRHFNYKAEKQRKINLALLENILEMHAEELLWYFAYEKWRGRGGSSQSWSQS